MEGSFPHFQLIKTWGDRVGGSLGLRVSLLILVVSVLAIVLGPLAVRYESHRGLACLSAAAAICLLTGLLVLLVDAFQIGGSLTSLWQMAFGLIFRMGMPLLICGLVAIVGGRPAAQSLARYLLVIYPVVLLLETYFTVLRLELAEQFPPEPSGREKK